MNKLRTVLAIALALLCVSVHAREISICADPDPPPWTYWVRDSHHAKTSTMAGSSVDIFTSAFKRLGYPVNFQGELP
jgi:hypothetical protein